MGEDRTNEEAVEVAEEERTGLFDDEAAGRARSRWESIQASFIDEPRQAVAEADQLVRDLADSITGRFQEDRRDLESAWDRGEEISTETLRVTLQRYRTFFERLLRM